MSTPSPTPEQRAEFCQQAYDMAEKIIVALQGEQPSFVVLEALTLVHKFVTSSLPPEVVGYVAMAMASYAGELMQADAKGKGLSPYPDPVTTSKSTTH